MEATAAQWVAAYEANYPALKDAAALAKGELTEALRPRPLNIHSIEVRAKAPDSVYAKIRRKGYKDPASQMTDILGARVITSFSGDIEDVVTRLKSKFDVDDKNSIDKRRALGVSQFGYRSVHLVLAIHKPAEIGPVSELLSRTKVEVQVRTIIEHAWAEAEHFLRYKSGIEWPENLKRRFNAAAATLEMVDREFDALTTDINGLVAIQSQRYKESGPTIERFDSAKFLAFMAVARPDAARLGPKPLLLPLRRASECVSALAEIGITNAEQLHTILESASFRAIIRDYADRNEVEPEDVSAAVCVSAVVALSDSAKLADYPALNDAEIRRLASPSTDDEDGDVTQVSPEEDGSTVG
ncbi:hypothetical protein AB0J74_13415 [Asanoa sp. NPDC049573]|uniref:GTP pyrophosphokinase n=1 Tax=Asanoa sp. NPDC049573 TaxID=3155396 RepID=UPI003435D188